MVRNSISRLQPFSSQFSKLVWKYDSLSKWRFLCSSYVHIGPPPPTTSTIEPRMVNMCRARTLISSKHVLYEYSVLDPHLVTHHSNLGFRLRQVTKLGTSLLNARRLQQGMINERWLATPSYISWKVNRLHTCHEISHKKLHRVC